MSEETDSDKAKENDIFEVANIHHVFYYYAIYNCHFQFTCIHVYTSMWSQCYCHNERDKHHSLALKIKAFRIISKINDDLEFVIHLVTLWLIPNKKTTVTQMDPKEAEKTHIKILMML